MYVYQCNLIRVHALCQSCHFIIERWGFGRDRGLFWIHISAYIVFHQIHFVQILWSSHFMSTFLRSTHAMRLHFCERISSNGLHVWAILPWCDSFPWWLLPMASWRSLSNIIEVRINVYAMKPWFLWGILPRCDMRCLHHLHETTWLWRISPNSLYACHYGILWGILPNNLYALSTHSLCHEITLLWGISIKQLTGTIHTSPLPS